MKPVSAWGRNFGNFSEVLNFSTPKSPENAFSGILYYFAIFQDILCKTYQESLQKQAVNMDLQCILCIANSICAIKTPKDDVTCDTYWKFYMFPSKREILRSYGKTGDNFSKWESPVQNGRVGTYGFALTDYG